MCSEIDKICQQEKIDVIVVGVPKSIKAESGEKIKNATESFLSSIKAKINLPIQTVDETLSSYEAEQLLITEGVDWHKAKKRIHQLSAVLILNQYFSQLSRRK